MELAFHARYVIYSSRGGADCNRTLGAAEQRPTFSALTSGRSA